MTAEVRRHYDALIDENHDPFRDPPLLAAYMVLGKGKSLSDWLDGEVFASAEKTTLYPDEKGREGFNKFMKRFVSGLSAERAACAE